MDTSSMKNGAIPHSTIEGETTRVTRGVLKASGLTADELLDRLVARVAAKAGDGNGGNNGGRKVFGVEASSIMKWLLTAMAGASVFVFTWYQAVNSGLKERPTTSEMASAIGALDTVVDQRFKSVEKDLRDVRESQIRIEGQAKGQSETMAQILQAIRRR